MAIVEYTNYRNKKITQFARDKMCTLLIPGICNGRSETSVWAHSNEAIHGKGKGIKAHDIFGCIACSDCHDAVDGRAHKLSVEEQIYYLKQGMALSIPMLLNHGVLA